MPNPNMSCFNPYKESVLHMAVTLLIQAYTTGVKPHTSSTYGGKILKETKTVIMIIEAGFDLYERDNNFLTAIERAIGTLSHKER